MLADMPARGKGSGSTCAALVRSRWGPGRGFASKDKSSRCVCCATRNSRRKRRTGGELDGFGEVHAEVFGRRKAILDFDDIGADVAHQDVLDVLGAGLPLLPTAAGARERLSRGDASGQPRPASAQRPMTYPSVSVYSIAFSMRTFLVVRRPWSAVESSPGPTIPATPGAPRRERLLPSSGHLGRYKQQL